VRETLWQERRFTGGDGPMTSQYSLKEIHDRFLARVDEEWGSVQGAARSLRARVSGS